MNNIKKNYIFNVLYQIFLVVVPLITAPYLTRTISSSTIGIYDYINSVVGLFGSVGLLGLNTYGYRQIGFYRDDKKKLNEVFTNLFTLRIILLGIFLLFYIPLILFSEFQLYYLLYLTLFVSYYFDISWVFIGLEKVGVVAFRNFIAKLLTVVGIFLFVKSDNDLWIYFILFGGSTLLTVFTFYPLLPRVIKFDKDGLHNFKKTLFESIKLFVPTIATMIYLQCDKIMLKFLTDSTSQVAYYNYAEKFVNIPLGLISALDIVLLPRIANLVSKNNKEEIGKLITKSIKFSMFLAIPMTIGISLVSIKLIPWYLGSEYIGTAYAMIILSPLCIINSIVNIFGNQLFVPLNDVKTLNIAYFGSAGINILLNFALIPLIGYIGAAIATLICTLFSAVYMAKVARTRFEFAGIGISVLKEFVSAIFMMIIVTIELVFFNSSWYFSIIEIVSGIIVYFFFSILLKDENIFLFKLKGTQK